MKYALIVVSLGLLCVSCSTQETQSSFKSSASCPDTYQPVCGLKKVPCMTSSCALLETTYQNRCFGEEDHAQDMREGACAF